MKNFTLRKLLNGGVCAVAIIAFSTTSCETNAKTGALAGAAAGAAIGAARGGDGSVWKGAAAGAAVGAAAGYAIKARRYKNTGGEPSSSYPYAKSTSDPNVVASPYGGHKVDVKGFSSGELAIDPKTDKIFRVP
tara:strand:+ start:8567 stop:8968 length:402 start_codon:yes stop_codon:yes gene_type:complete